MSGPRGDEFHRLRTAYLRLKAALRDRATGLFSYPLFFDQVRALTHETGLAGVLWVVPGERRLLESVYGWETSDALAREIADRLQEMVGEVLPEGSLVTTAGVYTDAFVVFVPGGRETDPLDAARLAELGHAVARDLEVLLAAGEAGRLAVPARVRVGTAMLADQPFQRFERQVHRAVEEARDLAERPAETERLAWLAEVHRLIREGDLHPVFQPVVDLESGESRGLEAYARGPDGSVLRLPRVLFALGREAGLAGDLDRLARRRTLEALAGREPPELLFLNTAAENLADPDWESRDTRETLERAGLDPSRVVLEVAEGELAGDPETWRETVARLRAVGYRFSLDDVGSSPRSIALVERLRPDFLKFDLGLARGLAGSQLQRELLRSLVRLAERAEARLVAERVESEEERNALLDCGARWGQGYLFAPEGPPGPHRPGEGA